MIKKIILVRNSLDQALLNKNFFIAVISTYLLKLVFLIPMLMYLYFSYDHALVTDSENSNNIELKYYIALVLGMVVFAPIIESVLLIGLIVVFRKLNFTATYAILIPAIFLALMHMFKDIYYPLRVLPFFIIYSYVFYYSLKITTVFGSLSRISVVHALHNLTLIVFLF